ncbi:MAG: Beta-lactam-inducible penicillin-binding protein [Microgenomates bacterium OLB22]|nr:MAG: Beta-lactam-inducible penicillin-binding protein [Microgenomates bacterium OLB22]
MPIRIAPFSKQSSSITFKEQESYRLVWYHALIPVIVIVGALLVSVRLFDLTIVKGTYYATLAEDNSLKELRIEAKRGTIFDRSGTAIAESTSSGSLDDMRSITGVRAYPFGASLAHMLGYRQLATPEDIKNYACRVQLTAQDTIGKAGIEKLFDCELRGTDGYKLVQHDARGRQVRVLAIKDPRPGESITLAVDSRLQQDAYDIIVNNRIKTNKAIDLKEHAISIIATKPTTGEVLTLLSYPSFDPILFEKRDGKAITALVKDPRQPLFPRPWLGVYPPGSVFKTTMATAALEEAAITGDETIEDTGEVEAGQQTFGNWFYIRYGKTDGQVDLVKSLQRSNDIYYYLIGQRLQVEGIKKWAHLFGYGSSTGLGFPEAEGVVPSAFWKKETIKERWYLGDTYNLSIGQGYLLTTPMQVHQANTIIANDGKLCAPLLLKAESRIGATTSHPSCKPVGIQKETIAIVKEGMSKACQVGGTGWPFFNWQLPDGRLIPVGCKTGTAESKQKGHPPHAWFTVFAPFHEPEIHVTILVEEAGDGSDVAAPIAKEMLTNYFMR